MELTWIDAVLLALVLLGGAWGLMAGAVKISAPSALILALITLLHTYPDISTRFSTAPIVQFFCLLLLGFIGLVVYGFVVRILQGAVRTSGLGPLNWLIGLGIGLVTGTILAGALAWGLETYGGLQGRMLLRGSILAPAVTEFFQAVMAFTSRLFTRPEPEKEPWWKRSLW